MLIQMDIRNCCGTLKSFSTKWWTFRKKTEKVLPFGAGITTNKFLNDLNMEKVVLVQEEMTVKQKLQDILMVLSWREMARSYFGKSSGWIYKNWTNRTAKSSAMPKKSSCEGLWLIWLTAFAVRRIQYKALPCSFGNRQGVISILLKR